MKDKPILFSAPMVRALLAGRKTQTRRLWKGAPTFQIGQQLWVREAWAAAKCSDGIAPSELPQGFHIGDMGGFWYPADGAEPLHPISPRGKTRSSLHMPRWVSRITLTITDIRLQRLSQITEEDAIAEGVCAFVESMDRPGSWEGLKQDDRNGIVRVYHGSAVNAFKCLWETLHGAETWALDPFVMAISFTVQTRNIDHRPKAEAA